jgi:hypothetical protein
MTKLKSEFEINEINEIILNAKGENNNLEKINENIDLFDKFLIEYGYLLNKNDITMLMRKIKQINVPNRYNIKIV